MASKKEVSAEIHGGDDVHKVRELVVDLSVTTNCLGPVKAGLEAVQRAVLETHAVLPQAAGHAGLLGSDVVTQSCPSVEHYPKRHDLEFRTRVACFLADDPADASTGGFGGAEVQAADYEQRLMLGAGASELIDLLGRCAPPGGYLIDPHVRVQYREYQRAAKNAGRELAGIDDARLIAIVNPNNPTGDFQERPSIERYIEQAKPGTWVLVDESMLFWAGPNWRDRGLTGRRGAEFIERMAQKGVMVFIVHSWTKIFSCTGLRIGSVLSPTPELRKQLEGRQVPWSVSAFAMAYLGATLEPSVVQRYLTDTWLHTPQWRGFAIQQLRSIFPKWTFHGHEFVSWVWVDTHDAAVARQVYDLSFECGCPIRLGAIGYGLPTCLRFAVRKPAEFLVLFESLQQHARAAECEAAPPASTCMEFEDYCTTSKVYDATRVPVGVDALLALLEQHQAKTLLDLGCGTGNYLTKLAPKLDVVHGIDANMGMLSQCAAKVERLGLNNVRLRPGSVLEPLPFADGALDAVAINQVLHHVDGPGDYAGSATAVTEAFRVLKPGGLLWVSYSDPQQTLKGYWYNKLIPRVAEQYAKRQVPRAHLEGLFVAAGFRRVASAVDTEPQQGAAYYNMTGPLTTAFRSGDSQWSMATPEEVAHAEQELREAMQHRKLGKLFDELDAGRHEVGQTTWTYGWK